MTAEFWILASLLVVIGLLIVIFPLLRKKETEASNVDQQNIDIARQKLTDLKLQLSNGSIDQVQYDCQVNELEVALSDDLSLSQNSIGPQKHGRWIAGFLIVLVPIVAVSLYFSLGDSRPKALLMPQPPHAIAKNKTATPQKIGTVDSMVSGLAERLKNQPDDLQGWVMLGKSYQFLKQFDKAVQAFAQANILARSDPEVMLHYADALVMVNQGSFTEKPKQLIVKALALEPDNPTALWLAGKLKAEEGDYVLAMEHLNALKPQLDASSNSYQELEVLMASIQSRIDDRGENVSSSATRFTGAESIDDKISGLLENVKNNSSDLQSWAELGKTYKRLKQYDQAISAFEKANLMTGKQANAMLMYADALVMKSKGQYSEQAKGLIFKALEIKPDDTTGLWLAGKARVQEAKYTQALQYLRRAEMQLQPGSQSLKIIQSYIGHVQSQLPQTSSVLSAMPDVASLKSANNKAQVLAEVGIQVKVSLSAQMQKLTTANDTLFIYAKAMSGPQMPLAIVRKKVSDLPLIVSLTDAQAMTPMMKLSKFQQVKITARISKTGNAMPQAGDLIGVVNNVSVKGKQTIIVSINKTIN